MEDKRKDARGTRGRCRVPRSAFAAVLGLVAILTVVSGSWASAGSTHFVLGPAGYSQGQDTLIVAGTQTPTLGSGDQVVICHALGMTNKDGYVQNAPAAGVTFGHAGAGHQAGEDIVRRSSLEGRRSRSVARERSELDDRRAPRLRERLSTSAAGVRVR